LRYTTRAFSCTGGWVSVKTNRHFPQYFTVVRLAPQSAQG
jgi:hypothetical protein